MIFNFAVNKAAAVSTGRNVPASGWLSTARGTAKLAAIGQQQGTRGGSGIYGLLVSGGSSPRGQGF